MSGVSGSSGRSACGIGVSGIGESGIGVSGGGSRSSCGSGDGSGDGLSPHSVAFDPSASEFVPGGAMLTVHAEEWQRES